MDQPYWMDRRTVLGAIAATVAAPAIACAAEGGQNYPALRATAERYVRDGLAPHVLLAIGRGGGALDYVSVGRHAIGAGPPVGLDSLYRLNSMTKPIVAFAVMALIEDGKFTLNTPLQEFYPAYGDLRVLTDPENSLETRPARKTMTIRHLITHSSGFGADFNITGPLKQAYEADGFWVFRRYPVGETPPKTGNLDDFAQAAASIPLLFEPGTSWRYSMGLDIAVAIIEKASGRRLVPFLQDRLLAPLGMSDTFYTVPPDRAGRMTSTYQHTPEGLKLSPPEQQDFYSMALNFPTGSGGLVASARDYCRFMAMLLGEGESEGARVLRPETAQLMMSNLMEPGVLATTSFGDMGYGAGGRSTIAATPVGEAPGTYGWSGASNTMFWVDRATNVYFAIMTQISQWYPNPIYRDFGTALYEDLA